MSGQTAILWEGETLVSTLVTSESVNEWPEYSLGELGKVITGNTPSKDNPGDWGEAMPFITPSDYKNYRKKAAQSIRSLSDEGVKRLAKRVLPANSVLVTCIGSDMGKVVMNATEAVTNQQINALVPNNDVVDANFLYYSLVGLYETLVTHGSDGTAVPILNKGDFEKLTVQIPPLPGQRAIASVLSSLDEKIDLLHRQNATLEALAETLFRQWFVEEAKEEWEERKVGDIATHLKVGVNPVANPTLMYCQYSLPAYDNGQVPTRELGLEILSNKYEVLPNTILISKLNPRFPRIWAIGENVEDNSVCSTEFQVFKPEKQSLYAYFYFLVKSEDVVGEMAMAASGTSGSHQRIRPEDILNIKVRIPSIEKAEEFSAITQEFIDKTDKNRQTIQTLSNLRDTLLPKLMSGEVRVAY